MTLLTKHKKTLHNTQQNVIKLHKTVKRRLNLVNM